MMWFEDLVVGTRQEVGSHCFTAAEIIAFARKFDPQYFHLDPVRAADGPYGGLIASGWHTAAIWMKLLMETIRAQSEQDPAKPEHSPIGPSPGFLDMKWPHPVRPGDTIRYSTELIEKLDLRSRPNWGLIRSVNEGVNQCGEQVLSFVGQAFIERRNPVQ